MVKLTVFTPTYNRSRFLETAYNALKRQTCKDFCWIIIDDGSTDDTKDVVFPWLEETDFSIRYYYKENGGLQTAYVEAIKHIETELCMCVDSDDYMMDDAVERLLSFWEKNGSSEYAGVVSLNMYPDGRIVGGAFPEGLFVTNHREIGNGKQGRTDNDVVRMYRTKVYEITTPAKVYPNEVSLNAERQFIQISMKYDFIVLNEPTVIVNYQQDGMTGNIFKSYFKSPNCYVDYRLFVLSTAGYDAKKYLSTAIHYVAECKIAKRKIFSKDLKRKGYVALSIIPGNVLYHWLKKNAFRISSFDMVMEPKNKR